MNLPGKKYRIILIVMVSLTALTFLGKYFLYDYSARLIGDILFEVIQMQGKSQYKLTNEEISFYPFEKKLHIRNLSIDPGIEDSVKNSMMYEAHIPELYINIASLTEIYFQNSLSITGISIVKPRISIQKKVKSQNSDSTRAFVLDANELYGKISRYLSELQVGDFSLDSGYLHYVNPANDVYDLNNFSLKVNKFSMDSVHMQKNNNPFFTEKIYLKLNYQDFTLKDHNHHISFDSLIISSEDSSFLIHNLVYKNTSNHDKQDSVNIPKLAFTEMDYHAFYNEKTVDLGKIFLKNPYVHLHTKPTQNTTKTLFNNSEYTFKLDSIEFSKGSIAYNDDKFLFAANEINLSHGEYILDPGNPLISFSQLIDNINMNGNSISLQSENLSFFLNGVSMDSKHSFLTIRNTQLSSQSNFGELLVDSELTKVSKLNIKESNIFELDTLLIENPEIHFKKNQNNITKSNGNSILKINHLNLISGDLTAGWNENELRFSGLNIIGNNLNSIEGIKNLNKIQVTGSNYSGETESQYFSGTEWSYNGVNNLLATKGLATKLGTVSEILLYDPDLQSISNKEYAFDSVKIVGADILLNGNPSGNNEGNPLKKIAYEKIELKDSKLAWKNKLKQKVEINRINLTLLANEILEDVFVQGISGFSEDISFKMANPHFNSDSSYLIARDFTLAKGREISISLDSIHFDNFPRSVFGYSIDSLSQTIRRITLYKPEIKSQFDLTTKRFGSDSINLKYFIPPLRVIQGNVELNLMTENGPFHISGRSIRYETRQKALPKDLIQTTEEGMIGIRDLMIYSPGDTLKSEVFSLKKRELSFYNLYANLKALGRIELQTGQIKNPRLSHFIENKELLIDSVSTYGMNVYVAEGLENSKTPKSNNSGMLRKISIPYFHNEYAFLEYPNKNTKHQFPEINLTLKNINWEPGHTIDTLLNNLEINLTGGPVQYSWKKKHIKLAAVAYSYSDEERVLSLHKFTSVPTINKDEFMDMQVTESNWINGSADEIRLEDFDMRDLLFYKKLSAQLIRIKDASMYVYRDKRLPDPVGYKSLPHAKITLLPIELDVDSVHINAKRITYVEKNDVSDYLGRLFFSDINGYLTNLYNDKSKIEISPLKFDATGSIMNAGDFDIHVDFITSDTSGEFSMDGTVGNMDLTRLNPILENSAQVSVNSGENKRIEFEFNATNQYALGTMKFYYEDLKVSVFNKENLPKGLGSAFKTFFANTFIVNTKNPHFLFVRQGDIFVERLKERSIINYWAKALLSGVVSSIGARNNKKEIRQLNQETKQELEIISD